MTNDFQLAQGVFTIGGPHHQHPRTGASSKRKQKQRHPLNGLSPGSSLREWHLLYVSGGASSARTRSGCSACSEMLYWLREEEMSLQELQQRVDCVITHVGECLSPLTAGQPAQGVGCVAEGKHSVYTTTTLTWEETNA
ncbi:guanine nucleotide exchange factor DBS-like isoform X1 [Arapaima gigas]